MTDRSAWEQVAARLLTQIQLADAAVRQTPMTQNQQEALEALAAAQQLGLTLAQMAKAEGDRITHRKG